MNTLSKIFLPMFLLIACDAEEVEDAEPSDAVAEAKTEDASPRGRGGFFKKLDVDGDGRVTLAEARDSRLADKFAGLDADKDGALTSAELQAMKGRRGEGKGGWHAMDPAERAARLIEKFDADKDGAIAKAEIAEHKMFAHKFAAVDGDSDGKLSAAELAAFKPGHGKRGHGERGHGERTLRSAP